MRQGRAVTRKAVAPIRRPPATPPSTPPAPRAADAASRRRGIPPAPSRALKAVRGASPSRDAAARSLRRRPPRRRSLPGVEELLKAAVAALRVAATAAGISPDEVEDQVAKTLAFLRRRLAGDFTVDEFGFDADFTDHVDLPLLRPLYRTWFRVEVRGIENIPADRRRASSSPTTPAPSRWTR